MSYIINYACWTDVGKCRKENQDNYCCDGNYLKQPDNTGKKYLAGTITTKTPSSLCVFDGMGGEECGEVASLIAAECASKMKIEEALLPGIKRYFETANDKICEYMMENHIGSMGTTAAMLVFGKEELYVCNIGDSKILRWSQNRLQQLSVDHLAFAPFGRKPPLSQCLGIPKTEMIIDPYISWEEYNEGDIYLLCSDGLTDMVSTEQISEIIAGNPIKEAGRKLLQTALKNGGRDNITIVLCELKRKKKGFFAGLFGKK